MDWAQATTFTEAARPSAGTDLADIAARVHGEVHGSARVFDLTVDSREVQRGWMFCAVRGSRTDGHDHAAQALQHGAAALLVERWLPLSIPQIRVPWTRGTIGPAAALVHGDPANDLCLIGVTGTNGKTTTAYLTESALARAGRATGLISTVCSRFGTWNEHATFTTPDAPHLQRTLARMRQAGADSVVMEVSSHGLDQQRVEGIGFDFAVWLNLAQEHLDYHGTMEHYYATKAKLFEAQRSQRGLVCLDDAWGRRLAAQTNVPLTTFGRFPSANVTVEVLSTGLDGTSIRLHRSRQGDVDIHGPIPGRINAANIAAAYLTAEALGLDPDAAALGIAEAPGVPGRFERVDAGQPFLVIIDYAHTPDALESLLVMAQTLTVPGGKVHLVLGSRGHKDRFKRPVTGRTATMADDPIFTTDSPGAEDPQAIINQMLVGALAAGHERVRVELDRTAAISLAIKAARPGDVVLLVGRGHEQQRSMGAATERFDDRAVALDALAAVAY
jgi:UDP-N-acetylmuramoyl-L-alanyl-D-glutamate--2,6-diaminopimelate ligase